MRMTLYGFSILCCCCFSISVIAAENKPKAMTCIPNNILVCESDKLNCITVPVVNIDGAYSVIVNLEKKKTETFAGSRNISAGKIDRLEYTDKLIFLSGYQKEHRDKKLPHSWNAVIDPHTGQLTFSSVANGIVFILNGVCTENRGDKP